MSSAHVEYYKGKIFTVLFGVFLGGAAAGGIGMKAYQDHFRPSATDATPAGSYESVEHLADELNLNDKQYSEIRSVLDECIMHEADMMNRIQNLRTETRQRISKILDSEQREKFDLLLHQVSTTPTPSH